LKLLIQSHENQKKKTSSTKDVVHI